jgi:hypothetical protein
MCLVFVTLPALQRRSSPYEAFRNSVLSYFILPHLILCYLVSSSYLILSYIKVSNNFPTHKMNHNIGNTYMSVMLVGCTASICIITSYTASASMQLSKSYCNIIRIQTGTCVINKNMFALMIAF